MQDEFSNSSWSRFWLILWAIVILDDADRREIECRRRSERELKLGFKA